MANKLGNKKAIVWALIECGVFTVFVYFAKSFESLLLLRFLAGIGIVEFGGLVLQWFRVLGWEVNTFSDSLLSHF